MNRSLLIAAALFLPAPAFAEIRVARIEPGAPVRELTVQSTTVVVAVPVNPTIPGRFKVLRVLLGSGRKEGDVFDVEDFSHYDLKFVSDEKDRERIAVGVAEVLLFLGPDISESSSHGAALVPSGLRVLAHDGTVYHVKHITTNDKNYYLSPYHADIHWDELIRKTEADAAEVHHIRSLKKIDDPHRRNLALLDWIDRHGREFDQRTLQGLPMDDGEEPTRGWGSLEQDVFTWVFETHIPRDCWEGVKLYSQLHDGWNPWLQTPAFGTRAGRKLLLSVVVDDNALDANRARALELLALSETLWSPPTWLRRPGASEPLDEAEQINLIDRITPLLKNTYPRARGGAAKSLLEMSSPQPDSLKSFRTQRALSALTAAYKEEPPGWTRNALAEAVGIMADPKQWEELTGNAYGVVAILNTDCRQGAEAFCTVVALRAKAKIQDDPMFVLERIDDKRNVVETTKIGLEHVKHHGLYIWPSERPVDFCEEFKFSMADFTPGVWRMTVKGFAGDDKAPWSSEPCILRLASPPKPDHLNLDLKKPRIVINP